MQWTFVPVAFTQGLSQKSDDKQITNQWLKLENVVMEKSGKFQKRRGLTSTQTLSGATTIAQTKTDHILLPKSTDVDLRALPFIDYGRGTPTNRYAYVGGSIDNTGARACCSGTQYYNYSKVTLYWASYAADNSVSFSSVVKDTNGYQLAVSPTAKTAVVGVADTTPTAFTNNGPCAIVGIGTTSASSSRILLVSSGNAIEITTGIDYSALSAHGYGNYVFVIYSNTNTGNIDVKRFNLTTGAVDKSIVITPTTGTATAISTDGVNVNICVGTSLYRANFDLTGNTLLYSALTGGGSRQVHSVSRSGLMVLRYVYSSVFYYTEVHDSSGLIYSFSNTSPAGSQPFTVNGKTYLIVTTTKVTYPAPWPGGFMIKRIDKKATTLSPYGIDAGFLYGYATDFSGVNQPYGNLVSVPTAKSMMLTRWTYSNATSAVRIGNDVLYGTSNVRLYTGAQSPTILSGNYSAPAGLWWSPIIESVTQNASLGSTLAVGDYKFLVVAETVSPGGNIVRSAASPIYSYTNSTANHYLDVTVQGSTVELDIAPSTTLAIFMLAPGASVWYMVKDKIPLPDYTILVTVGAPPIDTRALYTSGDVLEDLPSPAIVGDISLCKNRLWCFSAEAEEVRFSDEIYPGEIPLFSEAFALPLPQSVGIGQTVAELDGKILVFQEYAVSATFGDGPEANGSSPYPALQIIARDIGAIVPKSVITTNDGVFFLSNKGLWLINRSLTVQFIGTGIDDDASAIVCGAKLTDREQVWFFSTNAAFIWDAYHKIWTKAPLGITGITDAKVINNVLHIVANGTDYTLTGTSDAGGAIACKLTSGWMSFAGLQAYERIRRVAFLADTAVTATLTVTLRYDFSTTDAETFTVNTATVTTSGTTAQWLIRPKRQKCESMQIEISYSGSDAGVAFNSFALEVGNKGTINKMRNANKIGGN